MSVFGPLAPRRIPLRALFLGLAFPALLALEPPALEALRTAHASLLQDLAKVGQDGRPSLDEPATQDQVHRAWALLERWAVAHLDAHPDTTAEALAATFTTRQPPGREGGSLEVGALALQPGLFVLSAAYELGDGAAGTFFVLARGADGHPAVAWRILDLAQAHLPTGDELGRWAHLTATRYYSGSLVGTVHPLPPTRSGNPRFYVRAYQAAHGGTSLLQVSLWEWRDGAAQPLLVHPFLQTEDEGPDPAFDGRHLRFSTKERSKTFFSLGGFAEPRGLWTVRVTPDGIRDLGHRWRSPHLRHLDRICTRLRAGRDASDLASPQALRWMRDHLGEGGDYALGSVDGLHLWRSRGVLHFQASFGEGILQFTFRSRRGRPFLVSCGNGPA